MMKVFRNAAGKRATALALTGMMTLSPLFAQAQGLQQKQHVNIGQYCSIQASQGLTASINGYTPYRRGDSKVDVPVYSSKHGNITLSEFDCVALPPRCSDQSFLVSKSALIFAHSGLGDLNKSDTPSQLKAYELLAQVPGLISTSDSDALAANTHLHDYHGLDIMRVQSGQFKAGAHMEKLMKACVSKLDMG